jgi:hypothetical protein
MGRVWHSFRSTRAGAAAKRRAVGPTRAAHRRLTGVLQRLTSDQEPRRWSNQVIARVAPSVTGDVVHVSAWRDEDKSGRTYREYFAGARSYTTTNVGGLRGEGAQDDLHLDLTKPLDEHLRGAFDLVFNHTTLEHVQDVDVALENLFAMTRSEILLVVPFMQVEHWESPSFGDYRRFTEHGLVQACLDHGFEIIELTSNHNPVWPIYYCLHARRADPAPSQTDLWAITGAPAGFGYRPVEDGSPLMS